MTSSKLSINLCILENTYLVLVIYSLLIFSVDGILKYGSIPTYLILLGLFATILRSPKCLALAKFERPWFLILMCIALSVLLGGNTVKLSHVQSFLLMFLTYLYARSIRIHKESFTYLIWVFSSFLVLNLSVMGAQLATGNQVFFLASYDYLIPTGISSDQHLNGLLINISYAFIQSYIIRNGHKVIAAVFFITCLFFLVINTSRAGLLAYIVTTAYISINTLRPKDLIKLALLFFGGGILLYMNVEWDDINLFVYELLPQELGIAYDSALTKYTAFFTDNSGNERYTLWMSLMDLSVLDKMKILTFGLGPGSFDSINNQTIHNTLLDVLVSIGTIGLLSVGLVIFNIFSYAASRFDRNDCFAFSAVVISIIVSSMFHDFGRARFLWFFLGLVACCCNRQTKLNSSSS